MCWYSNRIEVIYVNTLHVHIEEIPFLKLCDLWEFSYKDKVRHTHTLNYTTEEFYNDFNIY